MSNKPWLAHYDKGVPQTIEYPKVPLFHFLEEAARKYPDHTCTIFKGAVISYREMNALTDHMAAALVDEMGVKKGDRVGLFLPNTPQFMIAYFGILKAGGVVVAVNPTSPVDEVIVPVYVATIEIMFTLSRFYDRLKAVRERSKLKRIIVTNIKETLPPITRLLFTLVKEKKEG
ncbi:MAG: AMP-binding protein, partial [Anaerolineales bacterium]|nr:AMP-binding protein [Anaerolineales bacterium]